MPYWFNKVVDSAIEAIYYNHDVEKAHAAMQALQKAADKGDADAMYLLARCYAGRDFYWKYFEFPEDDSLVDLYMEKSILHGSAAGVLGAMRVGALTDELEENMPFSDIKEAWNQIYEKAQAGCAFCQNMIANTYYWLDIVRIDKVDVQNFPNRQSALEFLGDMMKQSIPWYEKAFRGGMSLAGRNLVKLYECGEEELVTPEPHKALAVEKLGAELGYPEWKEKYGTRLIETGQDERRGVELCRTAAEEGQKIGWYEVAMAYRRGKAYPADNRKALQAAENGIGCVDDLNCCEFAASLYLEGADGVPVNYSRAFFLLERAEKQGSIWCKDVLAFCYAQGLGCAKDPQKAMQLLNRYGTNSPYARCTLGFLYAEGLCVPQNIGKAVQYWREDKDSFLLSQKALEQYKRTWYGKWVKKT